MNFTFHACLIRRSTAGSLLWLCCVTRHSSSIVARVVLGLLWAYTAPWIIIMTQKHSFRVGFSAVKPKPNGNNSSHHRDADNLKTVYRTDHVYKWRIWFCFWLNDKEPQVFVSLIFSFFFATIMKNLIDENANCFSHSRLKNCCKRKISGSNVVECI